MSIFAYGLLLSMQQGLPKEGLPRFTYRPTVMAGQREVALGPKLLGDTVMEVRFDTDVPAQIGGGRIPPPQWLEYAIGYVRWSVTDDSLFNKPCRVIKMDCTTKGENKTKLKKIQYACQTKETFWLSPDGKMLRQSVEKNDPTGRRHAEAVFWPDHVEVSIADSNGNKSFTLYPNVDLKLLDEQFKPMLDGEKVLMEHKEYLVFDPFTQQFDKYSASVNGEFHSTWLGTKFEGLHVLIQKDKGMGQTAFISKENDLIRVELPESTAIVLDNLPPDRDPAYKALKNKGSG